jgi:ABC-type transporter Mla MlaB component
MADLEGSILPAGSGAVLVICGELAPGDARALCDRLRVCCERSAGKVVIVDVRGLVDPDATAVDVLARLALTARRYGRRVELDGASTELRGLLAFVGLSSVLPCGSAVEARWQAE